ncbi:MAG TPA: hypothetical protein VH062_24145 [Polyangiaceae bacterium]|nr:hypothetical protein [Polyangiaceae bacterium]
MSRDTPVWGDERHAKGYCGAGDQAVERISEGREGARFGNCVVASATSGAVSSTARTSRTGLRSWGSVSALR